MPSTTTGRSSTALRRGDVVLVPFPYAELTATKTRPALIVSGARFAAAEGRITVAGITGNVAAHRNATSYHLADWPAAGLKKPSVVTSWLATISPRLVQFRIGGLTARDLRAVEQRLRVALEL
jgi:mRNA interferase MazF